MIEHLIFKDIVNDLLKGQMPRRGTRSFCKLFTHQVFSLLLRKKLIGLNKKGMGNIIYRKIRHRIFNICLHYPWKTIEGRGMYDYPVDGAVDMVLKEFEMKRVGFYVKGSPFGSLCDRDALYSAGRKNFAFSDFCDGYIFQKHFSDYEGCTVDPQFITEENLKEAIAYLPNASIKKKIKTRAQFLHKMRWDADFRRLYHDLKLDLSCSSRSLSKSCDS